MAYSFLPKTTSGETVFNKNLVFPVYRLTLEYFKMFKTLKYTVIKVLYQRNNKMYYKRGIYALLSIYTVPYQLILL
jgi:hypothetical protein